MTPKQIYARTKRLGQIRMQDTYLAAIQDHADRKGELAPKSKDYVDQLKQQIADARTERETAKAELEKTKADKQAEKEALQIQLASLTGKDRDPVRLAIDQCNAAIAEADKARDAAIAEIERLRLAREEALYQERLTEGKLLPEDDVKVKRDKEAEAALVAEYRQALKAKGLIDDPRAEERLANRARVKAGLEARLG